MWSDLVKTALIGTDKATPSVETLEKLHSLGVQSDEVTEAVLEGAGVVHFMKKSGYILKEFTGEIAESAEKETLKYCSTKSSQHLKKVLTDSNGALLIEFLYHIKKNNKQLSPELLPDILHQCRGNKQLADMIKPVIGKRGKWLIQQNADWTLLFHNDDAAAEIPTPPQLNNQDTLNEARQILDILRSNRALWTDEMGLDRRIKDFGNIADVNLLDKLEMYFEEDLPYYWQQRVRQTLALISFRRTMIDELSR